MTLAPTDYLIRCGLNDIGPLTHTAFETAAPALPTGCFTVSFWFRVAALSGRQVLVNIGNRDTTQAGWSVFLNQNRLALRVNLAEQFALETSAFMPTTDHWCHFAGIVDQPQRTLTAFLNGSPVGWDIGPATPQLAPGAENDDTRLIIGGYTDAAGGHFDHTFGRNGAGLLDDFRLYARALSAAEIAALQDEDNRPAAVRQNIDPVGNAPAAPFPITPVFINGQEGYACYRIPAIVRAANGDLLAFAEGRLAECSDSTAVIRLVSKRSRDNGATWEPLQVVARNLFNGGEYACMNPAPVVDAVYCSDRIVVVFNKMEVSEWDVVRGQGLVRVCCVTSDDHGLTWSAARDITRQVHRPYNPAYATVYPDAARPEHKGAGWRKHAVQPGHAIQLQAASAARGLLFFVGSYTTGDNSVFNARNYAFWSDDLGQSWYMGSAITTRDDGSSALGLNEAMAVELENGAVMVNSRNYQHGKVVGQRAVTIGAIDGAGQIHFQPARHDPALVDSGVQASIIRAPHRADGTPRLLFANPNHPRARINMTVRLSTDEGRSWPVSKVITPGPAAYSDLVIQQDGQIGLLFEQGNQGGIGYVNFSLEWLEGEV